MKTLKKATGKDKKKSNLYQILGDNGLQKYGTLDASVYRERLEKMSESDLQEEAEKYGYRHIHSREITINNLLSEFNNYAHIFSDDFGKVNVGKTASEIKSKKIRDILRAAR